MAVALAVALAGCGSAFEPGAPEQEGGYNFSVTAMSELSDELGSGYFEGKWTTWDPSIGVVVLGPEESGDPVAQLIINLGKVRTLLNPYVNVPVPTMPGGGPWEFRDFEIEHGIDPNRALHAESVTFSTTTQRVGTGAEINGKLYELGADTEDNAFGCWNMVAADAVYDDYIEGWFCFGLDRVIVNPGDMAETILVYGTFVAFNK